MRRNDFYHKLAVPEIKDLNYPWDIHDTDNPRLSSSLFVGLNKDKLVFSLYDIWLEQTTTAHSFESLEWNI